jgi:hypothetical protein
MPSVLVTRAGFFDREGIFAAGSARVLWRRVGAQGVDDNAGRRVSRRLSPVLPSASPVDED